MKFVSGKILTEEGFKNGYICFEGNEIVEIGKGNCIERPIAKGLILPTFVNAHTHIGDSFIRYRKIKIPRDIKKLVAPPNGLKHKLLKEADEEEIIRGMKRSLDDMVSNGTTIFCDFREGGIDGINCLKRAIENKPVSSIVLSRPNKLIYDKEEIDLILENSDGIGLSSISDWDRWEITKIAKHTKRRKKIFAIHASERIREDIEFILDLKPDFLVHMIKANESDFIRVKENNIPVVICPRSNKFFGLRVDLALMKKIGIEILLGTDNAMLNSTSILDEIKFFISNFKEFNLSEILYITTYRARKVLNLDTDILSSNSKARFVVINEKTLKPLYVSA